MVRLLPCIGVLLCVLFGFLPTGEFPRSAEAAASAVRTLPEVDETLYINDPVPLTPVECGQCHINHFSRLKENGGRHRFACQECHELFHMYNPLKDNYAELMPRCNTCHGQPHGEKQTNCLGCHVDPHAPQRAPAVEKLANICADCHAAPAKTLADFPSAHTEQGCDTCHHETHGYIPNCFECHEGHYDAQPIDACATCHQDVHKPLQIQLSRDSDTETCAVCHEDVYSKWKGTPSKHGSVNCSQCHTRHAYIPDCQVCHASPHDPQQLKIFPNCLTCHIDVHDLPVKR
jgi:hypothetical protein